MKTKQLKQNPKFKPCPFCGETNLRCHKGRFGSDTLYWVGCVYCGAQGPVGSDEPKAVARWQMRNAVGSGETTLAVQNDQSPDKT